MFFISWVKVPYICFSSLTLYCGNIFLALRMYCCSPDILVLLSHDPCVDRMLWPKTIYHVSLVDVLWFFFPSQSLNSSVGKVNSLSPVASSHSPDSFPINLDPSIYPSIGWVVGHLQPLAILHFLNGILRSDQDCMPRGLVNRVHGFITRVDAVTELSASFVICNNERFSWGDLFRLGNIRSPVLRVCFLFMREKILIRNYWPRFTGVPRVK